MSKLRISPMYRAVERLLDTAGVDYRIETGKKHYKVFIDDKQVFVFSYSFRENSHDNPLVQLRQAIRHAHH